MSTLKDIYDFETALESGFYAVLEACGVQLPKFAGDQGELVTPCATVAVSIGAALGRKYPVPVGPYNPDGSRNCKLMPDYYNGSVTIDYTTNRTLPEQILLHSEWKAATRAAFADFETSFAGKFQFHGIDEINEQSTVHNIDANNKTDISSITFAFTFHILPSAWPDSF